MDQQQQQQQETLSTLPTPIQSPINRRRPASTTSVGGRRKFSLNRSLPLSSQLGLLNNSINGPELFPSGDSVSAVDVPGGNTPPIQIHELGGGGTRASAAGLRVDESLMRSRKNSLMDDTKLDDGTTALRSPRNANNRSVLDLQADVTSKLNTHSQSALNLSAQTQEHSPGFDHGPPVLGDAIDEDLEWEKSLPSNNALKTLCLLYMIGSAVITVIGRGVVFVFLGIVGIIFSIEGYYGVANYDKSTIVRVRQHICCRFDDICVFSFLFFPSVFEIPLRKRGNRSCDWSTWSSNHRELLRNCAF
eukprot:TRINITY_DN1542_c0_g1_i4.p1 TRINITY_DN1542_c0_g1~~TRINITY_DN1542_c0_g1_i4.p1  ORF type:complete len:314 (-),score=68.45 TRINITY_DN1542_c0_g1_i4:304-1215(-)